MTAGISGYTSAFLFRQMGGDRWARHLLVTCVIFAGPFFLMFCVLNTVAISYRYEPGCAVAEPLLHGTDSWLWHATSVVWASWWRWERLSHCCAGSLRCALCSSQLWSQKVRCGVFATQNLSKG